MSSAILSADDLNDFINPGVACIKPVETLPKQQVHNEDGDPYQVTTEDKIDAAKAPPAQISLTDCLACSGCVTSAEAVLVSLQSHNEVLETLEKHAELALPWRNGTNSASPNTLSDTKVFVASVSPQARASIAATYDVSEKEASCMIQQLLSGPLGLRSGGANRSGFTWIIDTSVMREACLVAAAEEVSTASADGRKLPLLTSACPGWICYAEKTHPHILPHLSKLKSPQALTGTLVKSVLAHKLGIPPSNVWHMAVMPCFDKKLEASRSELTSDSWYGEDGGAIRDVDCVITARELLMLAESRDISFPCLPRTPVSDSFSPPFPDAELHRFLFRRKTKTKVSPVEASLTGTSGGYLYHVLKSQQFQHPGSTIAIHKGRNADVADFTVTDVNGSIVFKAGRYYGFRNIQNLVRRLKPAKVSRMPGATRKPGIARKPAGGSSADNEHTYVEVMACPGGCTNGGGQIKVGDVATLRQKPHTGIVNGSTGQEMVPAQKEWLARIDEAYWSADDNDNELMDVDGDLELYDDCKDAKIINGINHDWVGGILQHWASITGVDLDKLLFTTYRVVESDVGKKTKSEGSEMERVSALAVAAGGGW